MSFSRLFGKRQQPQQIEDNYNISEPFAIKKSNETVLDDGNSLSLVTPTEMKNETKQHKDITIL